MIFAPINQIIQNYRSHLDEDMIMIFRRFSILCLIALTGCTTINVSKVNASKYPINLICIEENPAVQVDDDRAQHRANGANLQFDAASEGAVR